MQIKSTKLRIFPTVSRNLSISGDINSRHASEEFLTGIVNKLIDKEGFVVTDYTDFQNDFPFRFNIHGYYFKVDSLKLILDELDGTARTTLVKDTVLYAKIATEQNGDWVELAGTDYTPNTANDNAPSVDEYVFDGLSIFAVVPGDKEPSPVVIEGSKTYYNFPILQKGGTDLIEDLNWHGTGWYVPADSYLKFEDKSFRIMHVDGGDLSPEA